MTTPAPTNNEQVKPMRNAIRLVKPVAPQQNSDNLLDLRQKDSIKFVFQIVLTAAIVVLCTTQLIKAQGNSSEAIYWSGITSTLAWWMPSPGTAKGNKSES